MAGVFVQCIDHGLVESGLVSHTGGAGLTMHNVMMSCPICYRPSEVIDGKYSTSPDGELVAQLSFTPKQLARLQNAISRAREHVAVGRSDASDAARALEVAVIENAPEIVPFVAQAKAAFRREPAAWVGVLIALIALFIGNGGEGISASDLHQLIEDVSHSTLPEPGASVSPEPTPHSPTQPSPAEAPTVEEP